MQGCTATRHGITILWPFLWMGFICLKTIQSLQGGSLLLTNDFYNALQKYKRKCVAILKNFLINAEMA